MTIRILLRILAAFVLAASSGGAFAQSCTLSSASPLVSSSNYDPFALADNQTQGLFSISCSRPKGGTNKFPSTFYVTVNNGLYHIGPARRLLHGTADYLSYGLFRDYAGCSQTWNASVPSGVFSLANANTASGDLVTGPDPLTSGTAFCFKVTAGTNTAVPGVYTDTVQLKVTDPTGVVWGTAAVTLQTTISPACNFTTAPAAITLSYTSFSATAVSGNSPFQLRCTNTTTYTLGFDTASGTVLGLNYDLTLNSASGTGSGLSQSYTSTATLPAGQAGTCTGANCTSTVTRSVVVTY